MLFFGSPSTQPKLAKSDSKPDLLAPAANKESILSLYNSPITPNQQTNNFVNSPSMGNQLPSNNKPQQTGFKPNYDINLAPVGQPNYPRPQYNSGYPNSNFQNPMMMGGNPGYTSPVMGGGYGNQMMGGNPMMMGGNPGYTSPIMGGTPMGYGNQNNFIQPQQMGVQGNNFDTKNFW